MCTCYIFNERSITIVMFDVHCNFVHLQYTVHVRVAAMGGMCKLVHCIMCTP